MRFGSVATGEAIDAILAHSVRAGRLVRRKGHRLSADDVQALLDAGVDTVTVVRLDPGDVHEDAAAAALANGLCGPGLRAAAPFTGRVNLFAEADGVLAIDDVRINALNRIDESLTVATLGRHARVTTGQMVATIKIIPFAVASDMFQAAQAMLSDAAPAVSVAPFHVRRVGLIQTQLPITKPSVLDKTAEITRRRLDRIGGVMSAETRCGHSAAALAPTMRQHLASGDDLILVIGASAITDRRDVIPEAIEAVGGVVEHFGMPVDPGNLLLLGKVNNVPVLGLPGCARSPKLNGMDWVLERLAADLPVTPDHIMGLGVGGLLAESPDRPQPREDSRDRAEAAPRIAGLILAAGQSRRMGAANKLLEPIDGTPMVRRVAETVIACQVCWTGLVLGHERARVDAALDGLEVQRIDNADFTGGLSTSLRAGVNALPPDVDGVLVCLGDMPGLTTEHLDRMIAAYAPNEGRAIIVPTVHGKRGNPVLWDRHFFDAFDDLVGDVGARHLIGENDSLVAEVPFDDLAPLTDIDTPAALQAYRAKRAG